MLLRGAAIVDVRLWPDPPAPWTLDPEPRTLHPDCRSVCLEAGALDALVRIATLAGALYLSLAFSLARALSLSLTHTLSHTHTRTHTLCLSLSRALSLFLAHSQLIYLALSSAPWPYYSFLKKCTLLLPGRQPFSQPPRMVCVLGSVACVFLT